MEWHTHKGPESVLLTFLHFGKCSSAICRPGNLPRSNPQYYIQIKECFQAQGSHRGYLDHFGPTPCDRQLNTIALAHKKNGRDPSRDPHLTLCCQKPVEPFAPPPWTAKLASSRGLIGLNRNRSQAAKVGQEILSPISPSSWPNHAWCCHDTPKLKHHCEP